MKSSFRTVSSLLSKLLVVSTLALLSQAGVAEDLYSSKGEYGLFVCYVGNPVDEYPNCTDCTVVVKELSTGKFLVNWNGEVNTCVTFHGVIKGDSHASSSNSGSKTLSGR